ncbi:unnamed protein product [Danaus chrysippus]|uniref:(African queen) hypothetical protein n=1 Tax=Danaus chrysippus TaxID=151541 RepID=A0A8J2R085_9NEOP|nr:unnamed protein product [Danaus chrysippus]
MTRLLREQGVRVEGEARRGRPRTRADSRPAPQSARATDVGLLSDGRVYLYGRRLSYNTVTTLSRLCLLPTRN